MKLSYISRGKLGNSSTIEIPSIRVNSKNLTNVVNGDVIVHTVRTGPNVIGGTFKLVHSGIASAPISVNASEEDIQRAIRHIDKRITVSKSGTNDQGLAKWVITFPRFLGNVPLLSVASDTLTGFGATVNVETLQDGDALRDVITISAFDHGHSGKGGSLHSTSKGYVTVLPDNDEATIVVPTAKLSALEDVPYPITGIVVVDVDLKLSGSISVSLSAENGDVLPSHLSGTLSIVNEKLSHVTYLNKHDWHGHDVISISILDGATRQLPIKVNAVNDAPVVEGPESLETYEDIGVLVPGVAILDTDGIILKWTVLVPNGKVTFNTVARYHCRYIVGSSAGGKNLTIEGSIKSLERSCESHDIRSRSTLEWGRCNINVCR